VPMGIENLLKPSPGDRIGFREATSSNPFPIIGMSPPVERVRRTQAGAVPAIAQSASA